MEKKFLTSLFVAMSISISVFAAGNFSVSGDELEFDMESNQGVAKGNVVLEQDGTRATGDYGQFNNKTRSGYIQGHVVADKDGYHITAETMTVHDDEHTSASGDAKLTKDGKTLMAPLIDYYKSRQFLETGNGRATLVDVDGSKVSADKIDYDHNIGIATAWGNVKIRSDVRKLVATADKAIYRINADTNTNYLELIGNAVATQDGNTVRGNRLKLNNTRVAQADGRVSIDFYPKEEKIKPEANVTNGEVNNKNEKLIRRVKAYPDAPEEA